MPYLFFRCCCSHQDNAADCHQSGILLRRRDRHRGRGRGCGRSHLFRLERLFVEPDQQCPQDVFVQPELALEFLGRQPLKEFALALFNLNAFLYVN